MKRLSQRSIEWIVVSVALAALLVPGTVLADSKTPGWNASGAGDGRERWVGRALLGPMVEFCNTDAATWREYQNGKHLFSFREEHRGPDFVELLDESRGIRVRL